MTEWLIENWQWVLAAIYLLEKIVKLNPTDKHDIVIDILWRGVKKLAVKR